MAGCKAGVASTLHAWKQWGLYSIAVQDIVKHNVVFLDTVEGNDKVNHEVTESPGVCLLTTTHWTVRAAVLSSISDNYSALMKILKSR